MTVTLTRTGTLTTAIILACICLPALARLIAGPPGATVHVRWAGSVDADARRTLEGRFRLADGEAIGDTTWRYDLVDTSSENIQRLVQQQGVEDTQYIDRSDFSIDAAARTARRMRFGGGSTLVTMADRVAASALAFVGLGWFFMAIGPRVQQHERRLRPCLLLVLIGTAVHAVALSFPPTDNDDMGYLASIASIGNPLLYFVGDHGHGNGLYRPLTPFSMWVVYQIFDVWALPNQVLNLGLHLANTFLLHRVVRRVQPDGSLAWLVAAVFMVSQFTSAAATWTSDRPMLLAGLALLLLINHLTRALDDDPASAVTFGIPRVVGLSVLALLGKESGMVVPLVGLGVAVIPGVAASSDAPRRLRLGLAMVLTIAAYLAGRWLMFGSQYAGYSQDGFMFFGLRAYENSSDLSPALLYLNYAENVLKNVLAPVLPIVADRGALLEWESYLRQWPVIASTTMLCTLAVRRRPSQVQRLALLTLMASALVHYSLFRWRLHYLSHAALCLFVGAAMHARSADGAATSRAALASKAAAVVVLLGSIIVTSQVLSEQLAGRRQALERLGNDGAERYGDVGRLVLEEYSQR